MNEIIIGQKINSIRKNISLSQSEFASRLLVSPQAVSKWERGESLPDIIMLDKIVSLVGLGLDYFSKNDGDILDESKTDTDTKTLPRYIMSASNWKDCDFSGLKNIKEKFNSSNILRCKFDKSNMSGTAFKANNICNSEFRNADLQNTKFASSNIKRNNFNQTDFKGSIFSSSNISDCDFLEADLQNAQFKSCSLSNSSLRKARLVGATFKNTVFSKMVIDADITNCSFIWCGFKAFEFVGVNFVNTFFKNQNMKKVLFANCSADNITLSFLKACKANIEGIRPI